MENKQDFVIENGVLQKYNGPGGDVTISAGVKEIGESAFEDCTGLTSVDHPGERHGNRLQCVYELPPPRHPRPRRKLCGAVR